MAITVTKNPNHNHQDSTPNHHNHCNSSPKKRTDHHHPPKTSTTSKTHIFPIPHQNPPTSTPIWSYLCRWSEATQRGFTFSPERKRVESMRERDEKKKKKIEVKGVWSERKREKRLKKYLIFASSWIVRLHICNLTVAEMGTFLGLHTRI